MVSDAPTRLRRLPFWAMGVALGFSLLAVVFTLLWFKLPTWAPTWVAEYSPWIDPIMRAAGHSSSARESAWKRLAGRGGGVAPAMIAYLETDQDEAVTVACEVLKEVVNPVMIVPVMRRLKAGLGRGADVGDLFYLVEALAQQQADLVVDALLPIPDTDESGTFLLIDLAGRLDDQRAVDALREILWEKETSSDDPKQGFFGHSAAAARSLAQSPLPSAKAVILQALEGSVAVVRSRVVRGLVSQYERRPIDTDLTTALVKLIKDPDQRVKEAVAMVAAFNPLPGAEAEFIKWVASPDPKVRSMGLTGLGSKYATEQAIAVIAKCLLDVEDRVRNTAISALRRTANPLVAPHVIAVYPSLPIQTKRKVLEIFYSEEVNRHAQVFPFLLSVMGDPDLEIAQEAEQVIWRAIQNIEQQALAESARDALQIRREQANDQAVSPTP